MSRFSNYSTIIIVYTGAISTLWVTFIYEATGMTGKALQHDPLRRARCIFQFARFERIIL